jgi:hypothetical protein
MQAHFTVSANKTASGIEEQKNLAGKMAAPLLMSSDRSNYHYIGRLDFDPCRQCVIARGKGNLAAPADVRIFA